MIRFCVATMLLTLSVSSSRSQEDQEQQQALAQIAKMDAKVTFEPAQPKRVIAVDL